MFSYKRREPLIKPNASGNVGVGTTSSKIRKEKDEATTAAPAGFTSQSNTSQRGPQLGRLDVNLDTSLLLEGMDSDLRDQQMFRVYRDMYWHDPICGSCVDLYSTLPFSEFTIGGADDKYLDKFREVVEVLNLRSAMPRISVDHQVTGAFCGSMLYNADKKKIYDLMTHKYDNIAVHTLPLYSQDPIMYLRLDEDIKATLRLDSKRIKMIREQMGEKFFNKLLSDELELDPIGTIYVPRKTFSFGEGVSYFKRVLPIWMIEKNLYRGTLIESGRRQRGIMHLMLGEEGWEPSPEDFSAVTDLFMDADADPIGAVVATRLGISVSEMRQGGDFWKVTDIWDQTGAMKMRALGISESFLSGDASYANMEGSMTVFVETMRAYRDMMTRRIFYEKVFPLVSMMNGYTIKNKKISTRTGLMDGNTQDILTRMQDGSKLFIPTVHWAKQLKPEQDQSYMEVLNQLTANGVPVPLRAMAAAGGFNLDELLSNQSEDLAIQRQLMEYNKQLAALKTKYAAAEGGGEGGMQSYSSDIIEVPSAHVGSVLAGKRMSLKRDYGEAAELFDVTATGKKKHIFRQAEANKRLNNKIVKSILEIERRGDTPLSVSSSTPHKAAPNTRLMRSLGI